MLGFINRTLKSFNYPDIFKCMYFSYVRSRLEYCSQVWAPTKTTFIDKIERVQRKFISQLCFKKQINYKEVGYHQRCKMFKIQTLYARRNVGDLVYLHKVLNNQVNCPYIVSEISKSAPERKQRNRSSKPVFAVKAKMCVRKDSFLPRISKLANDYSVIDVFHFTTVLSLKDRARPFFIQFNQPLNHLFVFHHILSYSILRHLFFHSTLRK